MAAAGHAYGMAPVCNWYYTVVSFDFCCFCDFLVTGSSSMASACAGSLALLDAGTFNCSYSENTSHLQCVLFVSIKNADYECVSSSLKCVTCRTEHNLDSTSQLEHLLRQWEGVTDGGTYLVFQSLYMEKAIAEYSPISCPAYKLNPIPTKISDSRIRQSGKLATNK